MARQKHPRTAKPEAEVPKSQEAKTRKSKGYRWSDLLVEMRFGALALLTITTIKIGWDECAARAPV